VKALTYRGPREIGYADVTDPTLTRDDQAIIEVVLAGICGSDLHIWAGHGFSGDRDFTIGHEAVGIVREVGSGVTRFAPGDRVLVPASVGCSSCVECHAGRVSSCRTKTGAWHESCYGLSGALPGCQAQYLLVPHANLNLVVIPEEVSDEAAVVLTDNAPTAWYGCRRARIEPGDSVLVIGLGPVGVMAAQSAVAMGAGQVLGIDPVPARRAGARAWTSHTIAAGEGALAEVRELTDGRGAHVVIEAVGADETIALALRAARHRGRISVIGASQNNAFPFPMERAQLKELEFAIGLCSAQTELPALLALTAAGRLDPGDVVSHRMPLSEGPRAYEMYGTRSHNVGKVVLDPKL
jgi:2-desacetyl-2-hydroxyethyl bacteriochlorophyllide A dehydrogenase